MKVVWSETAISQIRKYAELIKLDKPNAAASWIREIFERENDITQFPMLGRIVPEFNKISIREIIHGNHRIIYKIFKNEIVVTTVQSCKKSQI